MDKAQRFLARYESQEELDLLRLALSGAENYCLAHNCTVETKKCVLEVAAMSALPDYDCFDADWLSGADLSKMSRQDVFEYAIQWAVEW